VLRRRQKSSVRVVTMGLLEVKFAKFVEAEDTWVSKKVYILSLILMITGTKVVK
jgi:hypothetical protein